MDFSYKRYSLVVQNYLLYRPRYPQAIADILKAEAGLSASKTVADIGSGTGLLSHVFLKNGNPVYGVEPNVEMRSAAEDQLRNYANFRSIDATAENTKLPEKSVDFVTAGQAFHWFNHDLAHKEFSRILVPQGWVVLVWNLPRYRSSAFGLGYQEIWRKYLEPNADSAEDMTLPDYIKNFFAAGRVKESILENPQVYDFSALKGRVLSSIKSPQTDEANHSELIAELKVLFERFQENHQVVLDYETRIVCGQLG